MKAAPTKRIELSMDELASILQRAQVSPLDEKDCAKIQAVFETYLYLTDLLEDKATTIDRLRKLLFGSGGEKTRDVIPQPPAEPPPTVPEDAEPPSSKRPGHGRNGAEAYDGAEKIVVPHESLKSGDRCPGCKKGKVYGSPPKKLVAKGACARQIGGCRPYSGSSGLGAPVHRPGVPPTWSVVGNCTG